MLTQLHKGPAWHLHVISIYEDNLKFDEITSTVFMECILIVYINAECL
jgi:hypothetical protein